MANARRRCVAVHGVFCRALHRFACSRHSTPPAPSACALDGYDDEDYDEAGDATGTGGRGVRATTLLISTLCILMGVRGPDFLMKAIWYLEEKDEILKPLYYTLAGIFIFWTPPTIYSYMQYRAIDCHTEVGFSFVHMLVRPRLMSLMASLSATPLTSNFTIIVTSNPLL